MTEKSWVELSAPQGLRYIYDGAGKLCLVDDERQSSDHAAVSSDHAAGSGDHAAVMSHDPPVRVERGPLPSRGVDRDRKLHDYWKDRSPSPARST